MPRKEFIGKVVSDKMEKTAVVAVEIPKRHPVYGKIVKRTRRFKAHNELGAKVGDRVKIIESRPLSKEKRWGVMEIIK